MKRSTRRIRRALVPTLCALFLACTACTSTDGKNAEPLQLCEEPRPEMCTRQYDPVCARSDSRPDETAGNACTACSRAHVKGYVPGECSD